MQLFGKKEHLKEYIESAKNGNPRAQKLIYEMLSAKMYAVCLRYMGDKEAAQDVLQDARRLFINTALMTLRQHDVIRDSDDIEQAYDLCDNSENVLQRIGYEELLKQVASLPPGFRVVFNMYVIEGYSHKEIAEQLGIGEATSRSQLQRARLMLQERLRKIR